MNKNRKCNVIIKAIFTTPFLVFEKYAYFLIIFYNQLHSFFKENVYSNFKKIIYIYIK